ncbi:baseplate J/gp47 family protein [Nitrosomonas marina]|nr:baseplate J/gp47 family protein [Nitrosomonas marina]
MRRLIPELMPEWTDYDREADFGNVLLQLFSHMGDILSYYQDRIVNESFLTTAQERKSIIQHLRLIGYRLSTATPASTTLTIQFPAVCTDVVIVSRGDSFATKSSQTSASVRFECVEDVPPIDCSTLTVDDETGRKHVDIQVEEGTLIKEDIIGTSLGTAGQRFILNFPRLILRTEGNGEINPDFKLWTDTSGVIDEDWRLQSTLAFSLEDAKDYIIEIDENDLATVIFGGNGVGAIPAVGAVIKVQYRTGGGAMGNVAAKTITTITDSPALNLVSARVINNDAATGGSDRETIAHAVSHAPNVFRSLKRAVTQLDCESIALKFNGVGKVRAVSTNWNTVTLYVAPQGGGRVSDILHADLLEYFEDKRPLSTLFEICDVDYVKIYVAATVGIEPYYSKTEMRQKIYEAAGKILSFDNTRFGQIIYLSKFYEAIENIEGVTYVTIHSFKREGRSGPDDDDGKIQLKHSELARIPGSDVNDSAEDMTYLGGIKLIKLDGGY